MLRERQGRDRVWWAQMDACFHLDSRVTLSWFDGPGAEFVARSRKMGENGLRMIHRISPPVVHVHEHRAVLELPLAVERRFLLDGVQADPTAFARMLHQLERRDESWRILFMKAIYERDTLAPTLPGTTLNIDHDRPRQVVALYGRAFDWLGRSPTG